MILDRPIQSSPGKILPDSVFSHRTGNLCDVFLELYIPVANYTVSHVSLLSYMYE